MLTLFTDSENGYGFAYDENKLIEKITHLENELHLVKHYQLLNVKFDNEQHAIIAKKMLLLFFHGIHDCYTIKKYDNDKYMITYHTTNKILSKSAQTKFDNLIHNIEVFLHGVKYTNLMRDKMEELGIIY